MIDVLLKERRDAQIHKEESQVKIEVETGIMLSQTKEHQRLSATSRR